jgi:hypothetical protein
MPYHFYLLASMNSLDRSVAPLDSAMRRRFRVIHLAPRAEVARERLLGDLEPVNVIQDLKAPTNQEVGSIALAAWQHLNRGIARHWGPEFLLGHSYVLEIRDVPTLIAAFNETILPQLWELYRDRPTDLSDVLRLDEADEADALAVRTEEEGEIHLGLSQGAPIQPMNLAAMSVEDAVRRLFYLAFGDSANKAAPAMPAPGPSSAAPPSQP